MLERPFSILLTDLDGVVFWRIPAQKAGIPIIGGKPENYLGPDNFARQVLSSKTDRRLDDKVTPEAVWDAARHFVVPVFSDVARLFHALDSSIIIYGNTGRHHNPAMVLSTWTSLRLAGIDDRFTRIFFRQKGSSTVTSKVFGIKWTIDHICSEDQIVAADDNPLDLLPMATLYKQARFILIKDWTTERLLRGVDMDDYPNVTIAQTLRKGLLG